MCGSGPESRSPWTVFSKQYLGKMAVIGTVFHRHGTAQLVILSLTNQKRAVTDWPRFRKR